MHEKKKYIFLFNTVGGSAGGQLYLSSKVEWLQSLGWEVDVFYFDKVPVAIENLRQFEKNYIRNLEFRFGQLNKKERTDTLKSLNLNEKSYDKIIIESFSIEMALWGEYIASKIKATHICYLLSEKYSSTFSESVLKFLRHKLNQKKLYGITPKTIPMILPEANGEETFLRAPGCVRESEDLPLPSVLDSLNREGYTILSIGRLEKPYIKDLFKEVRRFAQGKSHPVNFIIIGDTKDKRLLQSLHSITDDQENLIPYYLKEVFPLPRKIFEISDVFVGCAGSVKMAVREGVPAISIDAFDHHGIGILGETTENALYRSKNEPPLIISELLEKIYKEREERKKKKETFKRISVLPDFTKHGAVMEMPGQEEYYDTTKVKNGKLFTFAYQLIKAIGGKSFLYSLKKLKHRFK